MEQVVIHRPYPGWSYAHHPHLTTFNGRLYAIWSNGRVNEDDTGQRVLLATSEDFSHWSPPVPLVEAPPGRDADGVLTAAGFHQYGGTLVAYYGYFEYQPDHIVDGQRKPGDCRHLHTALYAVTTTDGRHWSAPVPVHLPMVPNHGPQATASGRLLICGNIAFPYTDDPGGLTGWQMAGIYPPEMLPELRDDSEYFHIVQARASWPVGLCEGAFYQTDDGVLRMLLRSGTAQLWLTESHDDGATWSAPCPTAFPDNIAKFHFGRLPDGRFYYVGNPDPTPAWRRNPLVLSLSQDGCTFDTHFILAAAPYHIQFPGMHKGGDYGYPHSLVAHGSLYIIVSLGKEAIAVLRVALAAI